jgi:hypothetical protein
METINQFIQGLQSLAGQHLPNNANVPAVTAVAVVLVVVGLVLAVLGAKLARGMLTFGFVIAGIGVGAAVGGRFDAPLAVSGLLGATTCGLLGFVMYRLWVGVLTGVVLVMILSSTYGAKTMAPDWKAYVDRRGDAPALSAPGGVGGGSVTVSSGAGEMFTTPDPETQARFLNPEFSDWLRGFWDFTSTNDPGKVRKLMLISGCLALFGLISGLLAVRFTLVTITSIVGTTMLLSGATVLIQQVLPDLYSAFMDHPQAVAMSGGTFLLGSLVLQSLLTRPHKAPPEAVAAK